MNQIHHSTIFGTPHGYKSEEEYSFLDEHKHKPEEFLMYKYARIAANLSKNICDINIQGMLLHLMKVNQKADDIFF